MRGVLKWIGIIIGGLLLVIIVAVAAAYVIAEERLNRTYDIAVEEIPIPDQTSVDLDEWPLMLIELCEECHGPDLAGQVLDDDPLFGTLISANLTSGEGGIGDDHTDTDFVRALRHGVDHDGKPLIVMPSQSIGKLSDRDLAEVIAYVKNLPPVDNDLGEPRLGPLGRVFLVLGQIPDLLPAEIIDHDAPHPPSPEPGETAEYGEYLSFICAVCHTENLSGGPGAGEGMNLTPGGQLAEWSEDDFIRTIRNGVAPDGEVLDEEEMPWPILAKFNDSELGAIWLYLQSLPAIETEHR